MDAEDYAKASPKEQLAWCQRTHDLLAARLNGLRQDRAVSSRELSLAYTSAQESGFWLGEAVTIAEAQDA